MTRNGGVISGFNGKIMGFFVGIPGLVICSRLRTGKWHMKFANCVNLLGGSYQWWRLSKSPVRRLSHLSMTWKTMALKKPLTISGMVLQERLRNPFFLQKKPDKFVVKSKNLELARHIEGPRFSALGSKNLQLNYIEKNPQRHATCFWWLQSRTLPVPCCR